ncbi:MAG: hypothetical protein HOG18_03165, partial [Proteobacteria bacterium]|nr:hypothetical protein [Pseudomonadota bacterium]
MVGAIIARVFYSLFGLSILFGLWWYGGWLLESNPATMGFADFGPGPTYDAIPYLFGEGIIQEASITSGSRLGIGLLLAIVTGIPIGILMGRSKVFKK